MFRSDLKSVRSTHVANRRALSIFPASSNDRASVSRNPDSNVAARAFRDVFLSNKYCNVGSVACIVQQYPAIYFYLRLRTVSLRLPRTCCIVNYL